jgi:hypothetical protein
MREVCKGGLLEREKRGRSRKEYSIIRDVKSYQSLASLIATTTR